MSHLAISVHTAFGLAFDIEKALEQKSGFKPAQCDLGAQKELFGYLRLLGFASLLELGFAKHLVIVGGNEGRYKNESPIINRAWAIRQMLVHDFNISEDKVSNVASNSNTGGNIAAIKAWCSIDKFSLDQYALVSNLYHLPRAFIDLYAGNLPICIYPAEAFWLLKNPDFKNLLIERFGNGLLAERMAEEIQGIAQKLRGTYQPRTNTLATPTT